MLRKCPHHGFSKGLQVQYFYAGLLPSFKSNIDSSSNGSVYTRTVDDALKLFETMATTSAMWSSERAVQKKAPGLFEVDTYSALSAKIDSLFHKVESMSQTANAATVKKPSCWECGADHNTSNYPILTQEVEYVDYVQWGQCQQNNPNSETHNPGWRKHQNFSWSNQNQNQNQNHNRPQGQFQ